MARETYGFGHHLTTNTHNEAPHGLQWHLSTFLPTPRYETLVLNVNVSLDMANLQMINITALHFPIWQHLGNNQSDMQLQHLVTIPSIPVHKVYQHLLNSTMQLTHFNTDPSEDTDFLYGVYSPTQEYMFWL